MPFAARLPNEIRQLMQARAVSSSKKLTDIAQGDALGTLLGTVAEEISGVERRLQDWLRSFLFDAKGADLDDRVAQLPKEFPRRRGPEVAAGGSIVVTRTNTSGAYTLPAGALIVGRSDQANTWYTNATALTWPDGVATLPNGGPAIRVRAVTPGSAGNGDVGVIDIVRSPTSTIQSVTSQAPLANGSDGESDDDLRRRAKLWISSLMGWTNRALEALARNFPGSDKIRHARAYTDPAQPGYTELVIDDGLGLEGLIADAQPRSGVVPTLLSGTRHQFWFDYPAVGGVRLSLPSGTYGPSTTDWIALLERGVLITSPNPTSFTLTPEDAWTIEGHQVYTGVIAELQNYLDEIAVGAGLRVRVVPPRVRNVTLSANCVVANTYMRDTVFDAVKRAIIAFCLDLAPGDPLLIFQLGAELRKIPGVVNMIFDQTDRYPGSLRDKLTTTVSQITLR